MNKEKEKDFAKMLEEWEENRSSIDFATGKYGFNLKTLYQQCSSPKYKKYAKDVPTKKEMQNDLGPIEWSNLACCRVIAIQWAYLARFLNFFQNITEEELVPCILITKNILELMPRSRMHEVCEKIFSDFFNQYNTHINIITKKRSNKEIKAYRKWEEEQDDDYHNLTFALAFMSAML